MPKGVDDLQRVEQLEGARTLVQQARPVGLLAERRELGQPCPHAAVGREHHEQLPRARRQPLFAQRQQPEEGVEVVANLQQRDAALRPVLARARPLRHHFGRAVGGALHVHVGRGGRAVGHRRLRPANHVHRVRLAELEVAQQPPVLLELPAARDHAQSARVGRRRLAGRRGCCGELPPHLHPEVTDRLVGVHGNGRARADWCAAAEHHLHRHWGAAHTGAVPARGGAALHQCGALLHLHNEETEQGEAAFGAQAELLPLELRVGGPGAPRRRLVRAGLAQLAQPAGRRIERRHALADKLALLLLGARGTEAERVVEQHQEANGAQPDGLVSRAERRRPQRADSVQGHFQYRNVRMVLLGEALLAPVDPTEEVLDARVAGGRERLGRQLGRPGEEVACRLGVDGWGVGAGLLHPAEDEVALASIGAVDHAPVPQHVELRLRQGERGVDHAQVEKVDPVLQLLHVLGERGPHSLLGRSRADTAGHGRPQRGGRGGRQGRGREGGHLGCLRGGVGGQLPNTAGGRLVVPQELVEEDLEQPVPLREPLQDGRHRVHLLARLGRVGGKHRAEQPERLRDRLARLELGDAAQQRRLPLRRAGRPGEQVA
eukprot:scaffold270_cov121-Isochrysis_galbana.AAC.26